MAYNLELKQKAIALRQAGHAIKEVAKELNIAISTSSVWLRKIEVSQAGRDRMVKRKESNRYKMSQTWKEKRQKQAADYKTIAEKLTSLTAISPDLAKILCSLLYWAEGSKQINHIAFTNSDPAMIKTFLALLRNSYSLNETKFHVSVHLHEYHDQEQIMRFWSEITQVPLTQFIKPYLKPHTSQRKHSNYKGCITIRYYDVKIARELTAIYNALGDKY